MSGGFLDILIFAMIAAFLVFRLRSVLGRRTGEERPPPSDPFGHRRREAGGDDKVIELPDRRTAPESSESAEASEAAAEPHGAGLTQIQIADPTFDKDQFVSGARTAFEMIVHAYAIGDTGTLRSLLSPEVLENFSGAIQARTSAGETLETTVIGIKKSEIIEAWLDGRTACITVSFLSEQINVTRDADGKVIEGDPNQVSEVTDIWTFARNTRARDPNWKLVETRSPN